MRRTGVFRAAALGLLTVAVGAWSAVARADALPAATGFVSCEASNSYIEDPANCIADHDSATRSLSPFALLTATASYPGGFASANAQADGYLSYSFEVVGGSPGQIVPIDIDTTLQANHDGGAAAFAEIYVYTPALVASVVICSAGCPDSATSFSGTLHASAQVGFANTVHLEVHAGGLYGGNANNSFASADPYIYIDPSFAGASLYSIVQSDGVGNGPALPVPEPASVGLMVVGLAALGRLHRGRAISRRPAAGA